MLRGRCRPAFAVSYLPTLLVVVLALAAGGLVLCAAARFPLLGSRAWRAVGTVTRLAFWGSVGLLVAEHLALQTTQIGSDMYWSLVNAPTLAVVLTGILHLHIWFAGQIGDALASEVEPPAAE